jgi:hypothetical protein
VNTTFLTSLLLLPALAAGRDFTVFNNDGGWCWFEDERVIVHRGKLIAGSIAGGVHDPARKGDVEVAVYDLETGARSLHTLHRAGTPELRRRWFDDHNSPALLARPDGRILAMYSMHGPEEKIYYRISESAGDLSKWGQEKIFVPSPTSRITYSNLHLLRRENGGKGRIYDFFRGLRNSFKPSWAYSDDHGETWVAGNVFIDVPLEFRHRPYVKYASNGEDTVHFAYTEGHPRNYDNSIYHAFYRNGKLHTSAGAAIRPLSEGLKSPEEGTKVFAGGPNDVAWISDLHLDSQGHPYAAFSVQKDSAGLPSEKAGMDHRYRYARWTGKQWVCHEIAYAGSKLYQGEDDYTGNVALDPHNPNVMYISTNVDPQLGTPLISAADKQRHWEIFRGETKDGGVRWRWTAITKDSTSDNVRPVVPLWPGNRYAVLWLRGKMIAYTNYRFEVVGFIDNR